MFWSFDPWVINKVLQAITLFSSCAFILILSQASTSYNLIYSLMFFPSPLIQVTSNKYDTSKNSYCYCISLNVYNSDSLSIQFSVHINRYLELRSQLFELNWNSLDQISHDSSIVPVFYNLKILVLKFKFQNLHESQCQKIWWNISSDYIF